MALRRKSAPVVDGVPEELMDRCHSVWRSQRSADAWAAELGLTVPSAAHGPLSRHRNAALAWGLAEGLTRVHGRSPRPVADLAQLRAAGIPALNTRAEMKARIFGGSIDWDAVREADERKDG